MTGPPRMQTFLRFRLTFSIVVFQLVLMGLSFGAAAQEISQFEILDSPVDEHAYRSALSGANLEPYRFQDSDRVLSFDSGVEFKLSSAQSLADAGGDIDPEFYSLASSVDKAVTLVFKLSDDGRLGVTSQIDPKSKLAKIGARYPEQLKKVISQEEFNALPAQKQQFILDRLDHYLIR